MARKKKTILNIPLNRVEGDLELKIQVDDGIVSEAWSRGIMYRGFENMLKGRAPKDGLVLTPRVCGICGTAHLLAAAKALDMICEVTIPVNALIVRNLTSMAEHLQSDMRHGLLMFMSDFANPTYRHTSFYEEAVRRHSPFKGSSVLEAIKVTKRIIEIVAIIGGQWPNSSYMVPGGIAGSMTQDDIISCRYIITFFRTWYEKQVLGCTLERWAAVSSKVDLESWYDEAESHRNSEVGFFMNCCREASLDKTGRGHGNFVSYGQFEYPDGQNTSVGEMIFTPGFFHDNILDTFDQTEITEHVAHSRFEDYPGGLHPFAGETKPFLSGPEEIKYSLAKAPRYRNKPAETGPLAEMLCSGNPLFTDLVSKNDGPSVFTRQLARFVRAAVLLPFMKEWLDRIDPADTFYSPVPYVPDGRGYGLTGGCRGALGHWVTIEDGVIQGYQIITPTSWNGSPRDSDHVRGPWEEAVLGTAIADTDDPVRIGHVIRSFDACQVCSVHTVTKK